MFSLWIILGGLLGCAPASRRISAPTLAAPATSELPAPARTAWLDAAIREAGGDLSGAYTSLSRARAFDPDSPWLRLEQAELAIRVEDLGVAEGLLAEVERAHPEIPRLWVLKGRVQLQRQDVEGANASALRALELAPADEGAWRLRLEVAAAQGALDAAIAAWRAVPLQGPAALGARGLGLAPHDPARALDDLGAAFALGSADDAVVIGLVDAGLRAGRLRSAMAWLARRPDAEGQAVAHARARLGQVAGDPELELRGLIALHAQAASEDPGGEAALTLLGRGALARYRLGAPAAALRAPADAVFAGRAGLPTGLVFDVQLVAGRLDAAATLLSERRARGQADLALEARLADLKGVPMRADLLLGHAWASLEGASLPPSPEERARLALAIAEHALRSSSPSESPRLLAPLVAGEVDPALRPALLLALARAYEANVQPDLARATWEALLRLDPHQPDALLASARAMAASAAGPARALPRVEAALEAGPCSVEAWALAAELFDATGDAAQAAIARDNAARYAKFRRLP